MKERDLEIIIGWKCNNNCIFCSNRPLKEKSLKEGIRETTYSEIKKILEENENKKEGKLFIVGGEPTIIPSLFKILNYAKIKGYKKISIQTNGRMLKNEEFIKKLLKYDIEIGISVHGNSQEIQDMLTRVKGSFEQTINGMDNLYKNKKKFSINFVINNFNYKKIPKTLILLSKYKPLQIQFSLVSPVGMEKESRKKILPELSKLKPIIEETIILSKKINQKIKFLDIPLCITGEKKEFLNEKKIEKERKVIIKGMNDFFYRKNKEENEKEKIDVCKKCKKKKECEGIWIGYEKSKKTIGLKAFK